jgi:hypothetical protein
MARNIPLSLDDELLAEIDSVAESTKESRSAVMRRAIREGLGVVKSGGSADVIVMDSETSRDVNTASQEAKVSRAKFVIEAIRTGLQATYCRLMRDHWLREQDKNPGNKETGSWVHTFEHSMLLENPMGQEVRAAMRQRGAALSRFHDLLEHVPEAFARFKLVERLIQVRRKNGGITAVWGMGLSTEEVAWQIEMDEKYGGDKPLPKKEVTVRETARDREDKAHQKHRAEVVKYVGPPYPEE